MAKFNQLFIQIVLFLSLILFITSQIEWITYDPSTYSATYRHKKQSDKVTVAVDFQNSLIPYYIRVTATPEEGSTTPILCFSPTSNTCSENRIVITRNGDQNPAIIFVRREEFEDQELYIVATCQKTDCDYTLKFEGAQSAEINANSIFSYVVTNFNKEMVYEVVGTYEKGDYLTIGVEGSSSLELNIEDLEIERQPIYLDNGRIITFPIIVEQNNNILARFTIKGANIGDYLTLNIAYS